MVLLARRFARALLSVRRADLNRCAPPTGESIRIERRLRPTLVASERPASSILPERGMQRLPALGMRPARKGDTFYAMMVLAGVSRSVELPHARSTAGEGEVDCVELRLQRMDRRPGRGARVVRPTPGDLGWLRARSRGWSCTPRPASPLTRLLARSNRAT
jgi:hypothetical protein